MFDEFGLGRWGRSFSREGGWHAWAPDVEVFQKNDQLTIRADLPGLRREDVKVDVSDGGVCIQGERTHERDEHSEGYYRSERSYGSFNRMIPLPDGAIADQAKATFKDGVLEITMPAPPVSKRTPAGDHRRRQEVTAPVEPEPIASVCCSVAMGSGRRWAPRLARTSHADPAAQSA